MAKKKAMKSVEPIAIDSHKAVEELAARLTCELMRCVGVNRQASRLALMIGKYPKEKEDCGLNRHGCEFRILQALRQAVKLPEPAVARTIPLYHHRTDGGAEYLTDRFVTCQDGHKEGTFVGATVIIRLDGQPEMSIAGATPLVQAYKKAQASVLSAAYGRSPAAAVSYDPDAQAVLAKLRKRRGSK